MSSLLEVHNLYHMKNRRSNWLWLGVLQCGLLRMSGLVGRQLNIGSLIHVQSNVVLAVQTGPLFYARKNDWNGCRGLSEVCARDSYAFVRSRIEAVTKYELQWCQHGEHKCPVYHNCLSDLKSVLVDQSRGTSEDKMLEGKDVWRASNCHNLQYNDLALRILL